jgi:hypothetical protein
MDSQPGATPQQDFRKVHDVGDITTLHKPHSHVIAAFQLVLVSLLPPASNPQRALSSNRVENDVHRLCIMCYAIVFASRALSAVNGEIEIASEAALPL